MTKRPTKITRTDEEEDELAGSETADRASYTASLISQGSHRFYTLTMPSDVLAETCTVDMRAEKPILGFQRRLDVRRAREIAAYIDTGFGTIPGSIVLSAQPEAELGYVARDNTAWSLVKLYYSAFYAGNALIRLFGESCSFFDKRHIEHLNKVSTAQEAEFTFPLFAGVYRCTLDRNGGALRLVQVRAGAGGTHESFWRIFAACIGHIGEHLLRNSLPEAEAQAVYAKLESLRNLIRGGVDFSWLSIVRNDLQYRQKYGVWFPFKFKSKERDELRRRAALWSTDPMNIGLGIGPPSLGEFVSACAFIVALCHSLLAEIAQRSPLGPKCFVNYGPMAFLNDIKSSPQNAA